MSTTRAIAVRDRFIRHKLREAFPWMNDSAAARTVAERYFYVMENCDDMKHLETVLTAWMREDDALTAAARELQEELQAITERPSR